MYSTKETKPITEIVTSYEAACELTGTTPLTLEDFAKHPVEDQDSDFSSHQLNVIAKALNGADNEFDYSDDDQYKYFPYHYWNVDKAGGPGFSCCDCGCVNSVSFVGARHSYRSSKLAIFAGTHFEDIYTRFLSPYKPK